MTELPEMVVESGKRRVLHMLAYVRGVFDVELLWRHGVAVQGENGGLYVCPRQENAFQGMDDSEDSENQVLLPIYRRAGTGQRKRLLRPVFSWADWIGIPPTVGMSARRTDADFVCRYGWPAATARRRCGPEAPDRVTVDVDVLADTAGRKWTPNLSVFFRNDFDFDNFRIRFNYDYVDGDSLSPMELSGVFVQHRIGRTRP